MLASETGNHTKAYLIMKTKNPRKIKKIGDSIIATPEWLQKADQVMYDLLVMKFRQNPDLREKILATGNKFLVEATLNRYWGAGLTIAMADRIVRMNGKLSFQGSNWLGHQLLDVRRDLRNLLSL